ncbi:MAG: outer membrane lipoprotein-sorting protein [Candidatus Aminicenantaceae bacterium]
MVYKIFSKLSFISVLVFTLAVYPALSSQKGAEGEDSVDLDKILKKSAEYCSKLADSALYFVCLEKISEETSRKSEEGGLSNPKEPSYNDLTDPRRNQEFRHEGTPDRYRKGPHETNLRKNVYVYDYQLIKKGNNIEESRTLLEENGKKKNEKDAQLKTRKFYSYRSVLGPIGLLGKSQQNKFNYRIIEENKQKGRDILVIEATPKTVSEENSNYGRIWIDKENFQILRIDVAQESLVGYKDPKVKGINHLITITHQYDVEKNGLMFPSKTVFEENYTPDRVQVGLWSNYTNTVQKKTLQRTKLEIDYTDYKFFTVDVDVKY